MKKAIIVLILLVIFPINVSAVSCADYPTCFTDSESPKGHFAGMLTEEYDSEKDGVNRKGCLLTGECVLRCGYQSEVKEFKKCYGATFEQECATGYTIDSISILEYPDEKKFAIAYDFKDDGSASYKTFVTEKYELLDLLNQVHEDGFNYKDEEDGFAYIEDIQSFNNTKTCPNYVYVNQSGILNTIFNGYIWGQFCFDNDYKYCKGIAKDLGYRFVQNHKLELKHSSKDNGEVNIEGDKQHINEKEEIIYGTNTKDDKNSLLNNVTCDTLFKNKSGYNATHGLLKTTLKFMQYLAVTLALVLSVVDFIKVVPSQDKSLLKKSTTKAVTRLIIAVAIFLVPIILKFILKLIGFSNPFCDLL